MRHSASTNKSQEQRSLTVSLLLYTHFPQFWLHFVRLISNKNWDAFYLWTWFHFIQSWKTEQSVPIVWVNAPIICIVVHVCISYYLYVSIYWVGELLWYCVWFMCPGQSNSMHIVAVRLRTPFLSIHHVIPNCHWHTEDVFLHGN